jgi:hypothetical protein
MINLSGVFNFFIILVELCVIGALIFAAIDFIATDERFKKIAKIAVGGVLVVLFLFAVKAVFSGGEGGMNLTPLGFLYFAVGVILTLLVWYVIDAILGYIAASWAPFLAPALGIIRFVLAGLMLVVILLIAANVLFGASIGGSTFRFSEGRHGSLLTPDWSPTGFVQGIPGQSYPARTTGGQLYRSSATANL